MARAAPPAGAVKIEILGETFNVLVMPQLPAFTEMERVSLIRSVRKTKP